MFLIGWSATEVKGVICASSAWEPARSAERSRDGAYKGVAREPEESCIVRLTGVALSCFVFASCCLGLAAPAAAQQKTSKTITTAPLAINLGSQPGTSTGSRRTVTTNPLTITLTAPGAANTLSTGTAGSAGSRRSAITTSPLVLNLGTRPEDPGTVIGASKKTIATSPLVINLGTSPATAAGKLTRTLTASPLVINLATTSAAATQSPSKRAITTATLAITLTR